MNWALRILVELMQKRDGLLDMRILVELMQKRDGLLDMGPRNNVLYFVRVMHLRCPCLQVCLVIFAAQSTAKGSRLQHLS